MATIPKENIIVGNVIEPADITNIIDGLDGTTGYDIVMTATLRQGESTSASGPYSHAEGSATIASGSHSHAEGRSTQAKGDWSHTEGLATIASGSYQHVSGQYNTQGDTTSLFIVGNGTSIFVRSDAFKVRMSGSIVLPTTSSTAPTWTGTNGEIVPATVGGVHRLYMWMSGAWRSSSFA